MSMHADPDHPPTPIPNNWPTCGWIWWPVPHFIHPKWTAFIVSDGAVWRAARMPDWPLARVVGPWLMPFTQGGQCFLSATVMLCDAAHLPHLPPCPPPSPLAPTSQGSFWPTCSCSWWSVVTYPQPEWMVWMCAATPHPPTLTLSVPPTLC